MKTHIPQLKRSLIHEVEMALLMVIILIICKIAEPWLLHRPAPGKDDSPVAVSTNAPPKPNLDQRSKECLDAAAICCDQGDTDRGIELVRTRISQLRNSDLRNEMLQQAIVNPAFQPVIDDLKELQVQTYEQNGTTPSETKKQLGN